MSIGYGLIQWAGPFISLIFTPILTRILEPQDYGVAEYVLTLSSAIVMLVLLAIPQALMTHFNDHPEDKEWSRQVTGSAIAMVSLIGLPASLIFIVLAAPITKLTLNNNQQYVILFQIMGLTMIPALTNAVLTMAAQSALRVRWGMIFSLTTLVTTVVSNIVFIIILGWGAIGLVLVPIIAGLTLAIATWYVAHSLVGKPSFRIMKLLLSSGLMLQPAIMTSWILLVSDRLVLVHYVSLEALGHYTIANKIASLLIVMMGPVYSAWMPLALATQHETFATRQYENLTRYLIAVVLGASLFLGIFAPEILLLLTRPAYLPAVPYVGFLTYIYVFGAVGVVLNTRGMAQKMLKEISGVNLAGAAVNIILNFILIPRWGVWGAVIATVVGYAVPQILLHLILQKISLLPYSTPNLAACLALHFCLLLFVQQLPPLGFGTTLGIKVIIFGLMVFGLFALRLVTRVELEYSWVLARSQFTKWGLRL